jgi:hypothetical protein
MKRPMAEDHRLDQRALCSPHPALTASIHGRGCNISWIIGLIVASGLYYLSMRQVVGRPVIASASHTA